MECLRGSWARWGGAGVSQGVAETPLLMPPMVIPEAVLGDPCGVPARSLGSMLGLKGSMPKLKGHWVKMRAKCALNSSVRIYIYTCIWQYLVC